MAKEDKAPAKEEVLETTDIANPEEQEQVTPKAAPPKRKKVKKAVPYGQVHVQATFNNTIVTVTDQKGNVISKASAGSSGFRGSKKGTAYAAQVAADQATQTAKSSNGLSKADVFIKGIGLGRDAAVRVLATNNIEVISVRDVTGLAHGGVRSRKVRRI